MPDILLDLPSSSVSFDAEAFDEAVQAHGVVFEHERAMEDPQGLVDANDIRRPGGRGGARSAHGIIYTPAGCIIALMTSNSKELRAAEQGQIDSATASITPARFYLDSSGGLSTRRVRLYGADRLYLRDACTLVPGQQLVTASATGRDRLRFPAVEVDDLIDSAGIRWEPGADFDLVSGAVVWRRGRRPAAIYAVRYLYRAHWYVDRLMHEIRVAQHWDVLGNRTITEMQQAAIVRREYEYLAEAPDLQVPAAQASPREAEAPADDAFGPR